MTPLAHVDEEERDGQTIARIRGEVDASNARAIGERLRSMISNRGFVLLVDLTDTLYLDSAGIALLYTLAEDLRNHQQELYVVVAAGSSIERILDLAGLSATVPTYRDLSAAVSAAAAPSAGRRR